MCVLCFYFYARECFLNVLARLQICVDEIYKVYPKSRPFSKKLLFYEINENFKKKQSDMGFFAEKI